MEFLLSKVVRWFALLFNPAARAADRNQTGNRLLERGQSELAVAAFSEAIRLDPTLAAAHCNRAAVHYQMGRYPEALADVNETLRLDPHFGIAYALRGHVHLDRQEHDSAWRTTSRRCGWARATSRQRCAFAAAASGSIEVS